jgi:hypothetical protein
MNTLRTSFLLVLALSALLAPACSGPDVSIGSDHRNDACDCLAAYGSNSMDDAALRRLQGEGLDLCLRGDGDPNALVAAAACLPFTVGKDARTGTDIEAYYFCSDVCPNYGGVDIRYAGVDDKASCCALDGFVLQDFFQHFIGCAPFEVRLSSSCSAQ